MNYKASLDKTARVITASVTIVFLFIILAEYIERMNIDESARILTSVVMLLIYFITYAFCPLGYVVNYKELIIRRPLSNVTIKRTDIRSVEVIDRQKLRGSIRIFGDGGLFGYYGKFRNSSLGQMTWYVTRRDKIVLVQTAKDKKIILSPDDPQRFVSEFNF
jgi:Bacterial PH domain